MGDTSNKVKEEIQVIGPITISQTAVRRLVMWQSILSGLQIVAAATVMTEIVGVKWSALFIVLVAAAQQGINSYISKSVGEAVSHVDSVVNRAERVTEEAHHTMVAVAASLPPDSPAANIITEQSKVEGT